MKVLGFLLLGIGILLVAMGLLSRKWRQSAWGRQFVTGLFVIAAGAYLLLRD
jgi:hypothetical protein